MTFLPLVNIFFLVLIYRVHRRIFWITTAIESILYIGGIWYIESTYQLITNKILYNLSLTGVGLIIGVAAFFIAISLNHRHLYDTPPSKNE